MVAHGGEEEVDGCGVVIVHGVPRRDLCRPTLLHGEDLLLGLLDALRERLVICVDHGVVVVDIDVAAGAGRVGRLGDDQVEDHADDGGDDQVYGIPDVPLEVRSSGRVEREGERIRERAERRARDEREDDEETGYGIEHGVPLGLPCCLLRELRGQLVDAILQIDHAMHQVVRGRDSRQQICRLFPHGLYPSPRYAGAPSAHPFSEC